MSVVALFCTNSSSCCCCFCFRFKPNFLLFRNKKSPLFHSSHFMPYFVLIFWPFALSNLTQSSCSFLDDDNNNNNGDCNGHYEHDWCEFHSSVFVRMLCKQIHKYINISMAHKSINTNTQKNTHSTITQSLPPPSPQPPNVYK